jgi:hypothetical protein
MAMKIITCQKKMKISDATFNDLVTKNGWNLKELQGFAQVHNIKIKDLSDLHHWRQLTTLEGSLPLEVNTFSDDKRKSKQMEDNFIKTL